MYHSIRCQLYSTSLKTKMFKVIQKVTQKVNKNVLSDRSHKLHHLLPERNNYSHLRNNRHFNIPRCKTERFKNSYNCQCVTSLNSNLVTIRFYRIDLNVIFQFNVLAHNQCQFLLFTHCNIIVVQLMLQGRFY